MNRHSITGKQKGNLSSILKAPPSDYKGARYRTKHQNHKLEKSLDATKILDICKDAIEKKKPVQAELEIKALIALLAQYLDTK